MTSTIATEELSVEQTTLDEPVSETIMRDVRRVGYKLSRVLIPRDDSQREMRNWDLWGPLLLCLVLAIVLSRSAASKVTYDATGHAKDSQSAVVFASVFVIVWVGAAVISFNSRLLGGQVSFFQSICVLGYCICPLVIAAILIHIMYLFTGGQGNFALRLIQAVVTLACFVWSTFASVGFMAEMVAPARKLLALYPIVLFYLVIGWIVWTSSTPVPAHVPCVGPNCPLAYGKSATGGMYTNINGGQYAAGGRVGQLGGQEEGMMGGAEEQFANEAMAGAIGEHGGVQMTNDQGSESIGGMEETQTVGEGEGDRKSVV